MHKNLNSVRLFCCLSKVDFGSFLRCAAGSRLHLTNVGSGD
jgi:hypothetical protein